MAVFADGEFGDGGDEEPTRALQDVIPWAFVEFKFALHEVHEGRHVGEPGAGGLGDGFVEGDQRVEVDLEAIVVCGAEGAQVGALVDGGAAAAAFGCWGGHKEAAQGGEEDLDRADVGDTYVEVGDGSAGGVVEDGVPGMGLDVDVGAG